MHNTVYAIVKINLVNEKEEIIKLCATEWNAYEIKKSLIISSEHSCKVVKMEIE